MQSEPAWFCIIALLVLIKNISNDDNIQVQIQCFTDMCKSRCKSVHFSCNMCKVMSLKLYFKVPILFLTLIQQSQINLIR